LSLTGNLEDLPLLDIIQIVSFSKKTGHLTIRTPLGNGAIVFRDGSVVSAFTWDSLPADPRAATLPAAKRHALIRNRIEMALEQLIRLREGQFSFALADEVPGSIGGREIRHETLDAGINAQELLLDLARGIDEDRRDSSAALEASFAEPPEEPAAVAAVESEAAGQGEPLEDAAMPEEPPEQPSAASPRATVGAAVPVPATGPARTLLLVDDEEDVRGVLADHFRDAGFEVTEAEDPDMAVKAAGALGRQRVPYVLVTDLGMPTSGGASFQGGFEVVKRLWKMHHRPPVLMMTESVSGALRARARQMGVTAVVFKPGLAKLDPQQHLADLRAFAGKLVSDVLPRVVAAGSGEGPAPPPSRKAKEPDAPEAPRPTASAEVALLQRHLEELRSSGDPTQVSTLVMRVSREFFERGILFLVKNDEVRGLAGFGTAPKDQSLSLLVREVAIPLSEPSLFLDVVSRRKPWSGPLPDGRWCQHFVGKIGRFRSAEVALLPLLTHRETVALLFGDNPDTGRPVGRLDVLEVFLTQAGVALENLFLQRKLRALQERE
jgi:CheY-like chemotaxis protein